MSKGLMITGAILVALLLSLGGCYSYANGVRSTGIQKEQGLSAQYKMNQNELSTHTAKIYEMVDVANLKSAKMDTILSHAVSGRYGEEGFKPNGQFFSAIQEAYPQIDLSLYDRIVDAVQSGREAFKNQQNKLADMKREYDTWRYDGFVRSMFVAKMFPSERLEVAVGAETFRGQAALDKIGQMVLLESTQDAFRTGTMETMDLKNR